MKSNEDNHLEKLVEHMMKESSLESPSPDFTQRVMAEILATEKSKTLVYKPVISKKAWFIILGGILILFIFLALNKIQPPASASYIDLTILNFDKILKPFPGLQISPVMANVLMLAIVMLFIQIFLLKNYFTRKFQK